MTMPRVATTLVFDDDEPVYEALSITHRLRGWEIVRTGSLEAALRLVALRADVDVVCVDVDSPHAAEFLAEKARHPAVARLRLFLVDAEMKQDLRATARELTDRIAAYRESR